MGEPHLQRGEVLYRYERLYFQPRNICELASSNHHSSGMLHGKNNYSRPYHSLGLEEATTQIWGQLFTAPWN